MVGAVIIEHPSEQVESEITELYENLLQAHYMDDTRSYKAFQEQGFHATNDPLETQVFFRHLLASFTPLRILIQFSNGQRRPDLGPIETVAILYRELIRTTLQTLRHYDEVHLLFETHDSLDRKFEAIIASASMGLTLPTQISHSIGHKKKPYSLAVGDYAMHIFSRWHSAGSPTDPQVAAFRNWRAIRGSISMVRSLEQGTIIRRGLAKEQP